MQILKQLGFSDKEVTVYLAILKQGRVLPADIAKLTNLNRSTVYNIAGELKKRGVITEDLGGTSRYFVALPPEDLMQLASHEEQGLQQKKKIIDEAIQELHAVVAHSVYTPPKIVFITQEEIRPYIYKRTSTWNESIMLRDKTWWGFQDHTFVDVYGDWVDWYWTRAPEGLETKLLSNKSETEREMKKKKYDRRQICFWKDAGQFTATVWVAGDYLISVSTHAEPHYLIEIHDVLLAHNMQEVFKGIWKGLRK